MVPAGRVRSLKVEGEDHWKRGAQGRLETRGNALQPAPAPAVLGAGPDRPPRCAPPKGPSPGRPHARACRLGDSPQGAASEVGSASSLKDGTRGLLVVFARAAAAALPGMVNVHSRRAASPATALPLRRPAPPRSTPVRPRLRLHAEDPQAAQRTTPRSGRRSSASRPRPASHASGGKPKSRSGPRARPRKRRQQLPKQPVPRLVVPAVEADRGQLVARIAIEPLPFPARRQRLRGARFQVPLLRRKDALPAARGPCPTIADLPLDRGRLRRRDFPPAEVRRTLRGAERFGQEIQAAQAVQHGLFVETAKRAFAIRRGAGG